MGRIAFLGFFPVALLLGWDIYAHYQQAYTEATQKQLHSGEMAGERVQAGFFCSAGHTGGHCQRAPGP